MNNMIVLNLDKSVSSLKAFTSDISHSVVERLDVPSKMLNCIDCGVSHVETPISSNGYCTPCSILHQNDNY